MLRRLLARLSPGGSKAEKAPEDEEAQSSSDGEDEEGGFLRSRLDASVLYSHGIGGGTVEVEEPTVSEDEQEVLDEFHEER